MNSKRIKAKLLLRVSNSDQVIENQRMALLSMCKQRGYEVVGEYVGEGLSAWKGKHRNLVEDALKDARSGRYDVIMVWALDRLTREGPADVLRIANEFNAAGVKIVSLQEPWMEDGGDTRDLFMSVVGWTNRQESTRKSERNKQAHARLKAENRWGAGRPPLGYRRGPDGQLEVDPDESRIVELIYRFYASNRYGVRAIVRELQSRSIPTRTGKKFWAPSVIESVLQDSTYIGEHRSGTKTPEIIDSDTWQVAQERRSANHHIKSNSVHRYALQGRAVCECGSRIRVERPRQGNGRPVYYCNNRYRSSYRVMAGGERCSVPRRQVEELEKSLHDMLIECMDDPSKLMLMVERSITKLESEIEAASGDYGGLQRELDQVIEDLERVEESWLRRRIQDERRDQLASELEETRDSLETRLDEMSPERRAELEEKQRLLVGARDYLRTLDHRRQEGIPSWKLSFFPGTFESNQLVEFRSSEYNSFSRKCSRLPGTLDEVLTQFNMSAVFKQDRVELDGGIALSIPDPDTDESAHLQATGMGGS